MDVALEYQRNPNYTVTWFPNVSRNYDSGDMSSHNTSDYRREDYPYGILYVINISIFIICILGGAGNGIVIWLLGFRVRRNPFMTYILNLAIADLGLLVSVMSYLDPFEILPKSELAYTVFLSLFFLTYSTGQFLLTAISIDRCVAVFFPLWHRCHRPPRLAATVCPVMWILSILLTTATCTEFAFCFGYHLFFHIIVNVVLCLPLMTMSTVALFIKVCFKQRQHRRGKLLTILLLTLSFFLFCAFPLNVILILNFVGYIPEYCHNVAMLLSCLNSSVNPVIYFLVGRQRKTPRRQSLKTILQKAFKEKEACIEKTPGETQL